MAVDKSATDSVINWGISQGIPFPRKSYHRCCSNSNNPSGSPANVSYDTQGALDESPLDVSNIMD
ncbi:hypothetical protein DSO57_1028682 [Entomophthora muscae]|uniref:Uncharacterized protein n=1 Tax=Entomophthora muscae TaxID=34485 RepID=A0ACC2TNC1_9FUNG|nr:hypothetical protein DSO57_1028682 [Entomophthora muscae]